jgi:hypothetical protein
MFWGFILVTFDLKLTVIYMTKFLFIEVFRTKAVVMYSHFY